VTVNYAVKYRVQVSSPLPDTVLQPTGGVGWYSSGQIAVVQVKNDTTDKNGFPYVFDRWSGDISSNRTTLSFPVTTPVDLVAQWKLDWMYLLTLGGGFAGVAVPAAIVIRKKVHVRNIGWRRKEVPPMKQPESGPSGMDGLADVDMRVYNYIIGKGGSMKFSEALRDLNMSREEIDKSIGRLREMQLLH
jgi:hypothetical protein